VRLRLAVLITSRVCDRFEKGEGATDLDEIACSLPVPRDWIDVVRDDLLQGGVLARLADDGAAAGDPVIPLREPDNIQVADVVHAVLGEIADDERRQLELDPGLDQRLTDLDRGIEDALRQSHF
jgi:hypothetical protein